MLARPLLRTSLLVGFFAALAALEIWHGIERLAAIRDARRAELIAATVRGHAELVQSLRALYEEGRQHARYLSRSAPVRECVALGQPLASSASLDGQLLPYLLAFRHLDRVCLLDATGRERYRAERMGGGVCVIPSSALGVDAEAGGLLARLEPNQIVVSPLQHEVTRVEVRDPDRQVLHYYAAIPAANPLEPPAGLLRLTVYASPLLNVVRVFAPIPGAESLLVDRVGRFIMSEQLERDPPSDLRTAHPDVAARLLGGVDELRERDALYLATLVNEQPQTRLITVLPESGISEALGPLRRESIWVVASMAGVIVVLVLASGFFLHQNRRALKQREQARELELALRDRTRDREVERQLQITERLSSIGLLTAGMAHEINNPLEGIGNYLTLLGREPLAVDKRQRYLEQVRTGFDRIAKLVRDLLSFARPPRPAGAADVAQIVARALELVRFSERFRTVEVAISGLEQPLPVVGDASRLEQVVLNLLLNAANAMDGRGRLAITACAIPAERELVELRVEDDGPGIPEADLGRIFEPFFTTTAGSGLGLAISYGIVQAHGGTLTAANCPTGGACFTLRLARIAVSADESPERGP